MLGKLIKNEFIQTSKSLFGVLLSAAIAIGVMLISYLTKISWLGGTASFALIVIGIVAFFVTIVMVITNFYRSLYSNQGYLSFTLPVKASELLLSKYIVSLIWIIVGYAIMFGTILIVVFYTKSKSTGMMDTIMGMAESFKEIGSLPSIKLVFQYLGVIGLGWLITVISFVAFVYLGVTVANTRPFQNKQMLWSIIFFFISYIINKVVSSAANRFLPIGISLTSEKLMLVFQSRSAGTPEGALVSMGIGGQFFTIIFSVLLLLLTGWIMEKKVNIK